MNFSIDQIQMIRNECNQLEETRKISHRLLNFIYDQKLFKLFVPEEFGGRMLEFPSAIKAFQEASAIDGNFGWLITIGSGGGMFVPNMIEEAAKRFFTPREAVIAGSGFPGGKAQAVENGYRINGKWFYCSGSQYATVFTVTCVVEREDKASNEILAFALQPEQVHVLGDWDAFGLKGTSSHSIEVVDQFIPEEQVFSVMEYKNDYFDDVHRLPFVLFSEASFAAVSLGIGQHFLEEVEATLERNKLNWKNGPRYDLLNKKLNEEKSRLNKAVQLFHEKVNSVWEKHIQGFEVTEELQQEFSTIAKRCVTTTLFSANNLYRYLGMQIVMEKNQLNQIWRDLHTVSQHMYVVPYNEIETKPL